MGGPAWSKAGIPIAHATAIYTAFLFRQARGRELWSEDPLLPLVLGVQAVAALAVSASFYLESSLIPIALAAYSVLTLISIFVGPSTAHGRQGHHLMVRKTSFRAGVIAALLAPFWPPLVVLAFVLLDDAYVQAGQEVALS